ncbi:MAG: HAD hydrolase-like protein [Candidatus Saccharimonadales bacterium]
MAVIVFDFDGTLADSQSVILDIYNKSISPKWNLRPVSHADFKELRLMSLRKGARYIGLKPYQLPAILAEGHRLILAHTGDIKLFPKIPKLIEKLAGQGHKLYVLSTNSESVIHQVLESYNVAQHVHVLKSSRLLGKATALKKLLKDTNSKPDDMWMVGDEVRDIVAAHKAGVKSLAVTWGFQPSILLEAQSPTAIAHNRIELKTILLGS